MSTNTDTDTSNTDTSHTGTTTDNGVAVDALLQARAAMTDAPAAAHFTWKATNNWIRGTHSATAIEEFFGVGGDQRHHRRFELETDHPAIFAAEDHGVTPVEMVLAGLAGCLTAGVASVAQHRGIQLRSVTARVEGDMDLAGILGIDPDVRNGFTGVRVSYTIDADATREEIEAVVAQSQKRSAVFDVVTNPTNVRVTVV